MRQLLNKIELIDFKYQKLNQTDDFNLFTVLRDISDEVNLHSRFIYELLNPRGSHKQNHMFLSLFLETVGILNFSTQGVFVEKEKNNIDILITNNSKQAVILENKVGANDRDKQLFRYYNFLIEKGFKKNNISIIYLTLDGKEPTQASLGDLILLNNLNDFLFSISYKYDIDTWLQKCIKEAALFATLRESLVLYKKTINDMTGNSMKEIEKMEILKLVSENNNAGNVFKLVENWIHVRWHTEWDFWNELENSISKKYLISNLRKYSVDYLNSTIHKSRNREPWYGILFCIKKLGDVEMSILVERGEERLYYGIVMVKDNATMASQDFPELIQKLDTVFDWKATVGWLGGKFSSNEINFDAFNNTDTLDLVNPIKRAKIVEELWREIQEFINSIENKLQTSGNA